MFKNKKILSIFSVFCALVILIGGTFAFFSDSALMETFTKIGTVDIETEGGLFHSGGLNNLNPGDNDPNVPVNSNPGTDHEFSYTISNLGNKSVIFRTIIEVSAEKNNGIPFTEEELLSVIISEKQNVTEATTQNTISSSDVGKQTEIIRLTPTGYDNNKLVYIIGGTYDADMTYILNGVGDNAEIETTKSVTAQTIDIGLDKNVSKETYYDSKITIKISVEAMQYRNTGSDHWETLFEKSYITEGAPDLNRTVFAIHSDDDNSLTFFNRTDVPVEGEVYTTTLDDGTTYQKTVTYLYTNFIEEETAPWLINLPLTKSVVVADKISPTSTAGWFGVISVIEYYDLRKLDTSRVTDMSEMFSGASGKGPAVDVVILGLENWDTSNVINMNCMFVCAFNLDNNLDLSGITNWDVSNVKYANEALAGLNPRNDSFELDLSGWNLDSILEMDNFLAGTPKLVKLTLGPNFKFVDAITEYDSTPYLPAPNNTFSDGSGLWYVNGTNIGIAPEDVHKNATETITYVVYPTN